MRHISGDQAKYKGLALAHKADVLIVIWESPTKDWYRSSGKDDWRKSEVKITGEGFDREQGK